MIIGTMLLYALLAGAAAFGVEWLCGRLAAPAWLTRILYGATLVYVFWFLGAHGPIRIGA